MKKSNIGIYISCLVVVVAVSFAMLIDTVGAIVSSLITTIITTLGAMVIWIQLKRNGIKVSSELIKNMNIVLLKSPGLLYLRDKLKSTDKAEDYSVDGKKGKQDLTYDLDNAIYDDSINIIEYLEFFENIALMYFSDNLELEDLDNNFGDMFFSAMNNKYIQEREILPYSQHYINIIKLYKEWYKYRQARNIISPYNDNPLDYKEILGEEKNA